METTAPLLSLSKWLDNRDELGPRWGRNKALALRVGCSPSMIGKLAANQRDPSRAMQARIERITGPLHWPFMDVGEIESGEVASP